MKAPCAVCSSSHLFSAMVLEKKDSFFNLVHSTTKMLDWVISSDEFKTCRPNEYLLRANEARSCEVGATYFFWFNFQVHFRGEGLKTQKNLSTNMLVERKRSLSSRTDPTEQRRHQKMTKEIVFALWSFLSKPQVLL